jgi:hypothetical protein
LKPSFWLLVLGVAGIVGSVAGVSVNGAAGAFEGFLVGMLLAVFAYFTF